MTAPTIPQHPDRPGHPPTVARDAAHARHDAGYEHLTPLLHEFAATALDAPRRTEMREQLATGYLPLARNLARRYTSRGEPLDDLVQVASLGLLHALDRFDPAFDRPFVAFAVPTITGELRRHFRDRTWSTRVPRRLKDLSVSIKDAVTDISQQLDRAPRPSEIADHLGVSTEEVLDTLQATSNYRAASLDETLDGEDDSSATLKDTLALTDTGFDKVTLLHSVAPHLAALPTRERDILIMRFYHDMTQTQIATRIGLSQMQISRLLSATLDRLREAVDCDVPTGTPYHAPGSEAAV